MQVHLVKKVKAAKKQCTLHIVVKNASTPEAAFRFLKSTFPVSTPKLYKYFIKIHYASDANIRFIKNTCRVLQRMIFVQQWNSHG